MKLILDKIRNTYKSKEFKMFLVWFLTCIGITFVIEIMQRGSIYKAREFVFIHFSMFLLNLALVLVITSFAFLFKKTKTTFLIIIGLLMSFAAGGAVIIKFRGSPLTASDMYSLKDGFAIAREYLGIKGILIVAAVIIAIIVIIVCVWRKEKKRKDFSCKKNLVYFVMPALIFTGGLYKYNIDNDNIKLYRWNLTATYGVNGYLVSFIDSAKELIPSKPNSYTSDRIKEIKYGMDENYLQVGTIAQKPNIIVVQLESFIDPYRIRGVNFKEDPIPNVRKIQKMGPNGLIRVPSFGGGTVRSEFEVLTGYSANNLGPGELPNNTILRKKPLESMAYILGGQGYDTTAIHNYLGNFYNRDEVYANFGFDNLVTQEYIKDLKYTYDYPSDMSNFSTVKDLINRQKPQFIFNVAVESHGPYSDSYVPISGEYTVSGDVSEIERNQIQEYIDKAHEVDKYVGKLIDFVENSGEPTIIAMYGDHLPALDIVYDNNNYPEEQKYDTEYFIWSNIGVKPIEKDIQAYQLSTYILNIAGINAGIIPNFHKIYANDVNYQEYLKDIQFDQLYGENYLIGENIYKKSNLKLGIDQIKINKAYIYNNILYVEGENFTNASKIVVDGKAIQTTFENSNKVIASGFDKDIKTIEVGQEGMYGKMLSKTEKVSINK